MTTTTETVDNNSLQKVGSEHHPVKTANSTIRTESSSRKVHPVDTGWSWAIMIGTFGVHILTFGYIRSFGILFLEFQSKFEASSAMTAVVVGVQFCAYSLSNLLVVNVFLRHFSIRQSCLVGCFLQFLGIALNGVVTDIQYLLFTQGILFGCGHGFLYCPALIILSEYFNTKRAIATSIATCGVCAGGFVLPPLVRFLVETYGLRGGLLVLAAIMFHQAVFVSLFTPTSEYKFASLEKTNYPSDVRGNQCSNGPHSEEAESSHLLQQYSSGPHSSLQPDKHTEQTVSRGGENNTQQQQEPDTEEHVGSDHPSSITTSLLNWQSQERDIELSTNQLDTGHSNSQTRSRSRSDLRQNEPKEIGSEKGHDTDILNPPNEMIVADVSSVSAHDPTRKPSITATVLQALSTSSMDLQDSLHSLTYQGISRTVLSQGTSDKRNVNGDKVEKVEGNKRWRCRLPAVAKTVPFWVMFVFFATAVVASALPAVFIPPLAKEKGVADQAPFLLMMSAVSELIGRLGTGVLLHFGFMRPSSLLIAPMAACGTVYQFTALFNDFETLLAMAIISGAFTGVFWSLQSLVVIEVFGLERLGQMLGFYFLVSGLNLAASNPLGGLLRDVSGTYASTFHFFGAMYYVASLMMFIILFIKRDNKQSS